VARAYVILLLVTVVWGATFPMVQMALGHASPFAFVAVRFSLAAVFFGLITWPRALKITRERFFQGVVLGGFLFGGYIFQTIGLTGTTAARSGFITGMLVPLTPVFAWLLFRTRISLRLWIAVLLAFAGIWIMSRPEAGGFNFGDMMTLICAVVFALHIVFVSRWAKPENEVPLTWLQLATCAVLAAVATPFESNPHFEMALPSLGGAIVAAIFASALAIWAQLRYQPRISPAAAAVIYACEPVFAGLAAWVILSNVPPRATLYGAALIVCGMILSSLPVKISAVKA
jgi:drug/metabolite transporter (DMT)-like permease